MNNRHITTIAITALLVLAPAANAAAQNDSARTHHRITLAQRVRVADSLRLEMRRASAEGRMLQWGDSLLRSWLNRGSIDKKQYAREMRRLKRYDRLLSKGDSVLTSKYDKIDYDTNYITRPRKRWTVRLEGTAAGSSLNVASTHGGAQNNTHMKTDYQATASAGISYLGIGFSMSVNPAKLAGKNKDNELDINSYSNRYGFDIAWMNSETWHGHNKGGGTRVHVDRGTVAQHALNINGYYAFNYRRFSMPAAFSQTYTQRRSAGSVLLGASAVGMSTKIAANKLAGNEPVKVRLWEAGVGVGYGYNLVLGSRWLIHLSEIPTISVYTHGSIRTPEEKAHMHYHMPSAIVTGRAAAIYSWRNKFVGATIVSTFSVAGDKTQLQVRRNKFISRLFFGFRF